MIRVDHTTVRRQQNFVTATAAVAGECPEHADCFVEEDEPVLLRHSAISTDEQEHKFVDLSSAEWGCQRMN